MEVVIRDKTLRLLFTDPKARAPYPANVVGRYRRVVGLIQAAIDERDFRAFGKGLGFESLRGDRSHQHSFRLNDQFRLVVEITGDATQKIVEILEIVDYHD